MHASDTRNALPNDAPISLTELFTIGIGPSSSHTVGPMRAARDFALAMCAHATPVARVECHLYGSLALTGLGHATDKAVLLGLAGWTPEAVDPDRVDELIAAIRATAMLPLGGARDIAFVEATDIRWHRDIVMPGHPNTMEFIARMADGSVHLRRYYSVGGGSIRQDGAPPPSTTLTLPHPFQSGADLLAIGTADALSIAEIARRNEAAWHGADEADAFVDTILAAMRSCIDRGLTGTGLLPGGLKVRRRARDLYARLTAPGAQADPLGVFEWVSLWALAVNEENAGGGRVVTAPTNGAAGVIPAVLRYYETFVRDADADGCRRFLYTAGAIGQLYKRNASVSAAEMGCQGEIGVACSMAAAGLVAALGGSNAQVENAAEIGMEHNLGLTCDPVGGLVQIPCIERNTMGAVKAINAAQLALHGDGLHVVSLDQVIETMRQTGEDMRAKYKETSLGGLAVNVVEC
jgi:L-serine dehydratase